MGANSHIAIEYRPPYSKIAWRPWALDLPECRDYVLYALMAKVRGSYPGSFDSRGLPDDISEEVKTWVKKVGDHNFSWLDAIEFYTVCVNHEKMLKQDGYPEYNLVEEWQSLAEILLVLAKHYGSNNIRLVFAFDS